MRSTGSRTANVGCPTVGVKRIVSCAASDDVAATSRARQTRIGGLRTGWMRESALPHDTPQDRLTRDPWRGERLPSARDPASASRLQRHIIHEPLQTLL